jgi:hypothetical protein
VICTTEQHALPLVALTTRERRERAAREARLELALVDAVLEQPVDHAVAAAAQTIGVKMQHHARVPAQRGERSLQGLAARTALRDQ